MKVFAIVVICLLPVRSIAQTLPPTDVDLKASYCLRINQRMLSNMQGYVPGQHKAMDDFVSDAKDRSDRVRSYLLPRLHNLDATGLLAATNRADADMDKYSQLGDRCTIPDCGANETPMQCADRMLGCMKGGVAGPRAILHQIDLASVLKREKTP